mgnify:CR=1 FL=1
MEVGSCRIFPQAGAKQGVRSRLPPRPTVKLGQLDPGRGPGLGEVAPDDGEIVGDRNPGERHGAGQSGSGTGRGHHDHRESRQQARSREPAARPTVQRSVDPHCVVTASPQMRKMQAAACDVSHLPQSECFPLFA